MKRVRVRVRARVRARVKVKVERSEILTESVRMTKSTDDPPLADARASPTVSVGRERRKLRNEMTKSRPKASGEKVEKKV